MSLGPHLDSAVKSARSMCPGKSGQNRAKRSMSHPVRVKALGRERRNLKELALSSILSSQTRKTGNANCIRLRTLSVGSAWRRFFSVSVGFFQRGISAMMTFLGLGFGVSIFVLSGSGLAHFVPLRHLWKVRTNI